MYTVLKRDEDVNYLVVMGRYTKLSEAKKRAKACADGEVMVVAIVKEGLGLSSTLFEGDFETVFEHIGGNEDIDKWM